jgi:hypothetical protein
MRVSRASRARFAAELLPPVLPSNLVSEDNASRAAVMACGGRSTLHDLPLAPRRIATVGSNGSSPNTKPHRVEQRRGR